MRYFNFVLISFLLIGGTSCGWHIFRSTTVDTSPEDNKICEPFFKDFTYSSEKRKRYSVEQLLTLQKCGLNVHPELQFQYDIAEHETYPVPAILKRMNQDKSEYYQYYLIMILETLTETEKHRAKFLRDKDVVLAETIKTISIMKDKEIKRLANEELLKIRKFY